LRNRAKPRKRSEQRNGHAAEMKQHDLHQNIKELEEFKATLLPALRKDLLSGMTEAQIQKKYAAYVQTRLVQIALMEPDSGKAMAAAKDILDRTNGRATEKKEVTHRFKDMTDQELDAVLQSEESDLEQMEERFDS
jgi:glucuronate isomerase